MTKPTFKRIPLATKIPAPDRHKPGTGANAYRLAALEICEKAAKGKRRKSRKVRP